MGIRYIFGRAGTGKSHLVLEEMKAALKENKKQLIYIVPEQFTLQAERDLIEKMNLTGILEVEVLSFTRLAHRVFNEAGGLTRIHINEQGKNMALRKIIDEGERELTIYKKASRQEGFIKKLSELLCEFKQQDIMPLDLLEKSVEQDRDNMLDQKLHDIAYIYQSLDQYLEGRYIDSEDNINLLIERMAGASFLKNACIWIDGFLTYTSQHYRIIEKLMTMAEELTITFAMPFGKTTRDGDLFKISESTYRHIHDLALSLGIPGQIIDLDHEKRKVIEKSPEIQHIERELYAYPYQAFEGEIRHVQLFEGLNRYTEIENMAAQILSLARDRQYRWADMAVVCNDMDSYGVLIRRVFDEYGIPYFLDEKRSILHNPIVEFILSSLEVINKGYRYEDVFRLLKTGFTGINEDLCEKLENYVLQFGIQGNRWKVPFDRGEEERLEELNEGREVLVQSMEKLANKLKGKKTTAQITRELVDFLEYHHVHDRLEAWIEALRGTGQFEHVNENTQIWNIVMEIFDQLVEILGDYPVSLKEYIRILESGFGSIEIGIIPTTIDQVLVGNIQRSKSHDIKALFLIGVNDGVLPSGKDEEGILSEEERAAMKEKGLPLLYDSESKACQEKYMIYSALTKPSAYLWLSFSLADQEGKSMRPSILIDRMKKLFKGITVESDVIVSEERQRHLLATSKSTFKYLVESLRQHVDGKDISPLWWDVYRWYDGQAGWQERKNTVLEGLFHRNQENPIGMLQAKRLYHFPIRTSVSRLEQFVNCPFAHFVKYGLRPKERGMFQVAAPDIGEVFHLSIDRFAKKLTEQQMVWRNLEKDQCDQLTDQVIDELVPDHGNGILLSTNRYKYLINRLKRIGRRAIWTLTEHIKKGGFEPLGYEIGFGEGQKYPPITVSLPNGDMVYLEGRIDRVDLLEGDQENYIKIIDYKSGSKDFSLSDVYHGLELQLMIYLDAVLNIKSKETKKAHYPAGIFYFRIDDPMIKTEESIVEVIEAEIRKRLKMKGLALKDVRVVREMDQGIQGQSEVLPVGLKKDDTFFSTSSAASLEDFQQLIVHVERLIREISLEMMNGNIRIQPIKNGKATACQYCPYKAICQFDKLFEDNGYKNLKKLDDQEVLKRICEEEEER
ncbi:MAG: helicase-exonuclease AddAB subunit AddB [Bacillota bacterium]